MKTIFILYRLSFSIIILFIISLILFHLYLYIEIETFPEINWLEDKSYLGFRSLILTLFALAIWATLVMTILFTILSVLKKKEFYSKEIVLFFFTLLISAIIIFDGFNAISILIN